MAVTIEIHNTGKVSAEGAEIRAIIEHVLAGRLGDWRVSIVGSQENEEWELRILGPNGFERSYVLDGASGEHDPRAVGRIFAAMMPQR